MLASSVGFSWLGTRVHRAKENRAAAAEIQRLGIEIGNLGVAVRIEQEPRSRLMNLLDDPGVWLGDLAIESCEQGLVFLAGQDASGEERPDDAAYQLAAGLVAAQLNLAVGAEYCPAVDQAVRSGQLLLVSLVFDGAGGYLAPGQSPDDREVALFLAEQLDQYNAGLLCR